MGVYSTSTPTGQNTTTSLLSVRGTAPPPDPNASRDEKSRMKMTPRGLLPREKRYEEHPKEEFYGNRFGDPLEERMDLTVPGWRFGIQLPVLSCC